jgi:hypothetical protein
LGWPGRNLPGDAQYVYPIIAKYLDVGAAFSRDSRLQGAPARSGQKLTSGEFQKQDEIFIASCKSWGDTGSQAVINATARSAIVIPAKAGIQIAARITGFRFALAMLTCPE